tara:strand:+ start:612 stop:824 length:213 start_codon:yes stop_codon:yes gene_type:complete
MKKVLLHENWGEVQRTAKVYLVHDTEDHYEVEFYQSEILRETRKMITNGVSHNERYAEDAAENWCLGYIP